MAFIFGSNRNSTIKRCNYLRQQYIFNFSPLFSMNQEPYHILFFILPLPSFSTKQNQPFHRRTPQTPNMCAYKYLNWKECRHSIRFGPYRCAGRASAPEPCPEDERSFWTEPPLEGRCIQCRQGPEAVAKAMAKSVSDFKATHEEKYLTGGPLRGIGPTVSPGENWQNY